VRIPIVGVGASAGGLEAISELLEALPERCGAALIIVQHLDPTHESLLTEILARRTSIPVAEARNGVAIAADHIYVIPPNVTLTVDEGRLRLAPRGEARAPHMPVDALFRSLAEACGESAVGVVLSGADSDGALGTHAIKQAGGITFAQLPESARVPSMPRSAIETDCVDFVLRPTEIAAELVRLATHPYLQTTAEPVAGAVEEDARLSETQSLALIFRRLRAAHGVDFTRYKPSTLRRRLARRMALHRIDDLAGYVAVLEADATETAALYQDFLIRVTGFFRDPESFVGLTEHVFPTLCAGRSPKEPIRIWVPGCASGEEVYSIAIALMEFLGETAPPSGVQIFGTDVSETAIEKARAGVYLDSIAQDVSAERLRRYFVRQDSHYSIARSIRDLCIFARQDLTRDPPFSRLDLVSCRNLLIYLGPAVQQRVMQIFHYALRPHGFLALGPSESVGHGSELFEPVDKSTRLYARRPVARGATPDVVHAGASVSPGGGASGSDDEQPDAFLQSDSALRQADRLLLARYAPAAILVDDALTILQFRGETGPYLAPASGPPSLNLQRVLRPELLSDVSGAMREARESGNIARRPDLKVDGVGAVGMEVIRLPQKGGTPCYLIVFEDEARQVNARRARQLQRTALTESEKDRRLAHMERENADLREFLQATMEQHEAALEELKSANEEVLSANEEFQSTNEELETSKEELQSANEELTTTNDELRDRNRQLGLLNAEVEKARSVSERARTYAEGIVETVRNPLLVLDAGFNVLRANRAFYVDFELRSERIAGRSIFEVMDGEWDSGLREKLGAVLGQGRPVNDLEVSFTRGGGHRVLAVSARSIPGDADRVDLILLAIEDITDRQARADSLREGSRRKDEFLAMLAHELRNPLGPISHAVHLLKRGGGDAPKLHAMIERQTIRLVRLVDELLDVARISRGLIELKRAPVDLATIARQAIEASRARADQRQHTLVASIPDAPVCVDGDAVRLEQVVSNLLENAIKYTNAGGRISVALTEEGSDAALSVADNGIGLEPGAQERIFDLFTQVDGSLARSGGGLGLGLTVVRRVLEMHGGRIEAHSAGLGRGSEFVVRIPLLPPSRVPKRFEDRAHAPEVEPAKRRVLIVDDNVDSAESTALLVRSWGHDVTVVHDAAAALDHIAAFRPEAALVDIGLPDMNGYELARRLRAGSNGSNLQLVAMTGYGRAEDRAAARDAGFDVHLVKPAEPAELEKVLAHGR
jgi:two-component system CheB/CheR fusion protein